MSTIDRTRPVGSIKHDDKRAAIPDSAHQGTQKKTAFKARGIEREIG